MLTSQLQSDRIQVVIGLIRRAEFFLLSQRKQGTHLGGLWEFPGGKVETGEDLFAALKRELFEEVGIDVISAQPFTQIFHDYAMHKVDLHFWQIDEFKGEPCGKEGQRVEWVERHQLRDYKMPFANQAVIHAMA